MEHFSFCAVLMLVVVKEDKFYFLQIIMASVIL